MADRPRALIILPTYNEAENIEPLIHGLRRATHDLEAEFDIMVVDDGSPDGTAERVEALRASDPHLSVLNRGTKKGLGTAYRAGFDHALAEGHDFAFTMDADFSHNPEHVPHLWLELAKCDLVIGSRYIPGGTVRNWPWHRRRLSGTANALARGLLRLRARDCTSGFRGYRTDLLRRLDLDAIRSDGYSYLVEMLFRCQRSDAEIHEVPIKFVDRRAGASKISKAEILKAVLTLLRLRFAGNSTVKR